MASASIARLCKDKPSALGKGGPHRISHDISMEIAGGEFLGRVGPAGRRKTRLLRCFAWLEDPINPPDNYEALAALRKAHHTPIAAGENLGNYFDVRNIINAGAVDVVQPDAAKIGGITELWKAMAYAQEKGVRAEPHSPLYGPGWIASVHVVAAMQEDTLAEFYYADLEACPIGDMIYPKNGFMNVPQKPGLGISVDEKVIAKYRRM